MPRKPDERAGKAKKLYKQGMKLVEIAVRLGVPEGTVRRWKSTYNWDSERSDKITNVRNKKKPKKDTEKEVEKQVLDELCNTAEITEKQALFCIYYANSNNATTSYQKAYNCNRETAMAAGCRMLRNVKVREEIERLKKEKYEAAMFDERDIFQWHLDIATASITDFVSFGRETVPVINMLGPVVDKETGEQITKEINYIKFKESNEVDGRIIKKVKLGMDGASIELYDASKSMEWLEKNMKAGTDSQRSLASQIIEAYKNREVQRGDGE
ncbi:MAG: terminase small subunit [Lachnospiraceae bacterium]|nr:terminase small subunit [Lachnospiraceae bacterium]